MLSSPKSLFVLLSALGALWAADSLVARAQAPPQSHRRKDFNPVSARGKQTFASTCANCHGLDGKGSERAPNIADKPSVQRLSDSQISHIIENGIPGTGMPAFHSLESSQIKEVVSYLRALQGAKKTVKLPGDPTRGEAIFFSNVGCSGCHMIGGKGGFIASDLSGYARTHAVEQIRSAIIEPTPGGDRQVRLVTVTLAGGQKHFGRVRNEDNFSLQLQTLDGSVHFISKSDIESLEYNSETLMPSYYGSRLGPDELNDVVSYLMSIDNTSRPEDPRKVDDEEQ
jgi:cytochrome c oxidase cbb3-type subunit III